MNAGDELGQNPSLNEPLSGTDQFAHKLHDEKLTKFHTEINYPQQMAGLEIMADFHRKKGLGGKLNIETLYISKYKDDMVAYKRKREGAVERVASAQAQEARDKKSMQELLLGKAMR